MYIAPTQWRCSRSSAEIRERHLNAGAANAIGADATAAGTQAMSPASAALAMVCSTEAASLVHIQAVDGSMSVSSNGSNNQMNMLGNNNAGMTPKNNKRLFVKHSYKDFSVLL
jgi:hypothetical protein